MSGGVRLMVVVACDDCSRTAVGSTDFKCPQAAAVTLPDGWRWKHGYGEEPQPMCDQCVRDDEARCAAIERAEYLRKEKQAERNRRAREKRRSQKIFRR